MESRLDELKREVYGKGCWKHPTGTYEVWTQNYGLDQQYNYDCSDFIDCLDFYKSDLWLIFPYENAAEEYDTLEEVAKRLNELDKYMLPLN